MMHWQAEALLNGRTVTVVDQGNAWLSVLSRPEMAIRTLKSAVPTRKEMEALARLTFANNLFQMPRYRRRAGIDL